METFIILNNVLFYVLNFIQVYIKCNIIKAFIIRLKIIHTPIMGY